MIKKLTLTLGTLDGYGEFIFEYVSTDLLICKFFFHVTKIQRIIFKEHKRVEGEAILS